MTRHQEVLRSLTPHEEEQWLHGDGCMALWVAAGSGRAEVATGELQGGIWSKKVLILMCLGAKEIMISEITSSGCHPRVGSCK